jgi:Na+-transporting NADH:ubiquinone oxidoreductase subunit C
VHSNKYTFIYAAILTVVAAVLLALAAEGLRPLQEANIRLEKKANILKAAKVDVSDKTKLEDLYAANVQELVVDLQGNIVEGVRAFDLELKDELSRGDDMRLPLFLYETEEGRTVYILPLRGTGLWGPIWGFISLEDDFNTVFGANFDHQGETPGLGAEISTNEFFDQFPGKKIFGEELDQVALKVVKFGTEPNRPSEHRVDGISGGTITTVGTSDMIRDGIMRYQRYFEKVQQGKQSTPEDVPQEDIEEEKGIEM